jgi:hypothetical protein
MNLHNVAFAITNAAIWLTVVGGNGRTIGDHLWELPEGEPPEFDGTTQQTWNRNYWSPTRFSWRPFNYNNLMREGYVAPLCGRRSQARRPRINLAWGNEPCQRCLALATERGIIPLTYNQAQAQSTTLVAITTEMNEWVAAGRPNTWP